MVDRHIVKKNALELITDQKTMPADATIVILASDVLALREKLGFSKSLQKNTVICCNAFAILITMKVTMRHTGRMKQSV